MPPRWGLLFPDAAFLHKCRPAGAFHYLLHISTQMLMKHQAKTLPDLGDVIIVFLN